MSGEVDAGRAVMPAFLAPDDDSRNAEMGAALAAVRVQQLRAKAAELGRATADARIEELSGLCEDLADALTSCVIRFDDLGQGDSPTAQHARDVLGKAGR